MSCAGNQYHRMAVLIKGCRHAGLAGSLMSRILFQSCVGLICPAKKQHRILNTIRKLVYFSQSRLICAIFNCSDIHNYLFKFT